MISQQNKKGFTIIEVVLVLAIAGLIFLMVFIALPMLQRNQRDTQRREDMTRFMSQLTQYQTNNRGKIPAANPTSMNSFLDDYMKRSNGEFVDPKTGANYTVVFDGDPDTTKVVYKTGMKCNGKEFTAASGSRAAAVRIKLESSGTFCKDTQ